MDRSAVPYKTVDLRLLQVTGDENHTTDFIKVVYSDGCTHIGVCIGGVASYRGAE
jgi:hypothetical protein